MTSLLWLRRDLRRGDHPALCAAGENGPVLAVFIIEPALWGSAGPVRRGWLAANVLAARESFDGALCVRVGSPGPVLAELTQKHGVDAVHHTRETTPWAVRRDGMTRDTLRERGVELIPTGTPYAVGPGLVTRANGEPYKVFTPFSRAWRAHGWPAPAPDLDGLDLRRAQGDPAAEAMLRDAVRDCPVQLPEPGEQAARERWADFLDTRIDGYGEDRDRPDLDGSTRLSPYLKVGAIHPRTLLDDLGRHSGAAADRLRTELAWREFYADVLWRHPRSAWRDMRSGLQGLYDSSADGEQIRAWEEGRISAR